MVVKTIIGDMLPSIWPMVLFISIIAVTLRCAYLFKGSRKFVLHKELLSLVFIVYILCLYYILMNKDSLGSGLNLIPFKEIFRYKFGSYKFMKNVVGNILLFVPFGYFASYYLTNRKVSVITMVTLIVSASAEGIQYYLGRIFDIDDIILNVCGGFVGYLIFVALNAIGNKLPRFTKSDAFINFIVIVILILLVIMSYDIDVISYFK